MIARAVSKISRAALYTMEKNRRKSFIFIVEMEFTVPLSHIATFVLLKMR